MVNFGKLMKQAKKLQEDMLEAQKKLSGLTVEGTAGGGAVKAVCNGELRVQDVKIAPEVLRDSDTDMLQDLVLAAVRDAQDKAKKASEEVMGKVSGPVGGIPGMM
ncbi:MAG: YbaB/EbfC family nucleoid-associated protein [Candidatus Aureabacteria bacterium]|nr:YbaB/EbfC family nucleoid-associated protein [Candidatus Auribacterota bacterium]